MATADDFRRIALAGPGAVEGAHMGHPDFRTGGRIFATLHGDLRHGMVVLTPDQQQELIRREPAIFSPEAGAWGRQGSTRVSLASADTEVIGEALTLAWQNVAARAGRKRKTRRP